VQEAIENNMKAGKSIGSGRIPIEYYRKLPGSFYDLYAKVLN
jgi:hypothetical protein